jgi:hypothetical protein
MLDLVNEVAGAGTVAAVLAIAAISGYCSF